MRYITKIEEAEDYASFVAFLKKNCRGAGCLGRISCGY